MSLSGFGILDFWVHISKLASYAAGTRRRSWWAEQEIHTNSVYLQYEIASNWSQNVLRAAAITMVL